MLTYKPTIHLLFTISMFLSVSGFSQDNDSVPARKERKQLAENEGMVKFLVDVDNGYFEVLVNDTLWLRQYKDTLPAGKYEAKVWSPGYVIHPIDFEIKAGEVTEKFVNMVFTNDRQKFEADYKAYRMNFHKSFTVPASVSLGISLWTGYHMIRSYDLRKK